MSLYAVGAMPTSGKSAESIAQLYDVRRRDQSPEQREMLVLRQLFNSDIETPLTERFGQNEYAAAANFAVQNLEQMAKRVASTQPTVRYASTKQGKNTADARKRQRELANKGWLSTNNMPMLDRKRSRFVIGYGFGPMQIVPHDRLPVPKWNLRDPLHTYAGPMEYQDSFTPRDCIFAYKRSWAWLKNEYPEKAFSLEYEWQRVKDKNCVLSPDTQFECVEYVDENERVISLIHREASADISLSLATNKEMVFELLRVENRIGVCPVVMPHQISIDRVKSPYIGNYGMYIMRNKLAALEFLYAERTVFPERYFVEPPASVNGEIVSQADGERGIIGHLKGGTLQDLALPPNFTGTQMIDRLEREERVSNSTPAEFGGESATNIRTAARGNRIISEAIDVTIQETQEIFEVAKRRENQLAAKIDVAYFNRPKAYNVGWEGKRSRQIDYKPSDIFDESDENYVFYASAGADINQLVISGGQRVAQQTMSRETFMEIDPLVEDVESERDKIVSEQLEQSILVDLLQPQTLDVVAKARIAELVKTNQMSLADAVAAVQKERQEAQATSGEPGSPTGPVEPGAPEAQPGIAPGSESGIALPQGVEDLAGALSSLRRPQMTVNGA